MEYHGPEYHVHRPGVAPWVWVLIVLAAMILVFVIWWAVAAQAPPRTVVVPGPQQPTAPPEQPPAEQPAPSPQAQQPQVVERERPVNIYIERDQARPTVVIVPRGQQPPEARVRLRQVDLPDQFRYQGKTWQPSDQAVTRDEVNLKDTGATVDGNIVYAEQGAGAPYDRLYLETEPGSGVYITYEPTE